MERKKSALFVIYCKKMKIYVKSWKKTGSQRTQGRQRERDACVQETNTDKGRISQTPI